MTITAIILNYKNYDDIRACLLSLAGQKLDPADHLNILVIDNGSGDDSTKRLEPEFPNVQYIYNAANLGFAKAVNQGLKTKVASDYFLLVNNDAELDPLCLSQLMDISQGAALVGPSIFYKAEPDIVWQGGGRFSKTRLNITVADKNKPLASQAVQAVDFLSGCVLLIPQSVINKIGFFDEQFFFYGEDLDFSLRAKKAGVEILYAPEAKAWHNIKRAAESRTSVFVLKNLAYSYIRVIKKHFPSRRFYGALLFIFIYTPFRLKQIIAGGQDWRNIQAWLKGGWLAWQEKI